MLVITLDPQDVRPLYLQIMDDVRRALVVGTLKPNDPVPSVRELAAQLAVNPRTVLQAYQELELDGILHVRRGQGTFVTDDAQADRGALAREVAKRALLDARRHGVGVPELVKTLRNLAVEEEEQRSASAPAATRNGERK